MHRTFSVLFELAVRHWKLAITCWYGDRALRNIIGPTGAFCSQAIAWGEHWWTRYHLYIMPLGTAKSNVFSQKTQCTLAEILSLEAWKPYIERRLMQLTIREGLFLMMIPLLLQIWELSIKGFCITAVNQTLVVCIVRVARSKYVPNKQLDNGRRELLFT